MLLRENLGRRHDRDLIAILHRHQSRQESNQGLAAPHISLHQAVHRKRRHHVLLDLGKDAALGMGQGKRQELQKGLCVLVIDLERNPLFQGETSPLQGKPEFQIEEFIKHQ